MGAAPKLSIVSPVFQAEKIIPELISRLSRVLPQITEQYEIILVEDGSADSSWTSIEVECRKDNRIKGIKLSRNFGQHYAITAGLDNAKGDWVVVMDCDLQDRPEEIPALYNRAKGGFDIVLAKRRRRKDGILKSLSSRLFYKVLGYLSGTIQDHSVANFGIYHSKVITAYSCMREPTRFFPTMVKWLGFSHSMIEVDHSERYSGRSSYNWTRLFRLALDIILTNSEKPIRLIIKFGFTVTFVSLFIGAVILYRYYEGLVTVPGYTSLLVSLWFIGGVVIFILGLLGLYIGKIFQNVKDRPIYIISEKENI